VLVLETFTPQYSSHLTEKIRVAHCILHTTQAPAMAAFNAAPVESVGLHPMCAPPPVPSLRGKSWQHVVLIWCWRHVVLTHCCQQRLLRHFRQINYLVNEGGK
jgi:hypothetical protein